MISSHRTTKAYREGLESAKNTLPYMKHGKLLVSNPYSHGAQKKAFSKGFSYALNNWRFLLTVNNN